MIKQKTLPNNIQAIAHFPSDVSASFFEKYNFEKLKHDMSVSKEEIGSQVDFGNKENVHDKNNSHAKYMYLFKLMETKAILNSASEKKREIPKTSLSPMAKNSISTNLLSKFENNDVFPQPNNTLVLDERTIELILRISSQKLTQKICELNQN